MTLPLVQQGAHSRKAKRLFLKEAGQRKRTYDAGAECTAQALAREMRAATVHCVRTETPFVDFSRDVQALVVNLEREVSSGLPQSLLDAMSQAQTSLTRASQALERSGDPWSLNSLEGAQEARKLIEQAEETLQRAGWPGESRALLAAGRQDLMAKEGDFENTYRKSQEAIGTFDTNLEQFTFVASREFDELLEPTYDVLTAWCSDLWQEFNNLEPYFESPAGEERKKAWMSKLKDSTGLAAQAARTRLAEEISRVEAQVAMVGTQPAEVQARAEAASRNVAALEALERSTGIPDIVGDLRERIDQTQSMLLYGHSRVRGPGERDKPALDPANPGEARQIRQANAQRGNQSEYQDPARLIEHDSFGWSITTDTAAG